MPNNEFYIALFTKQSKFIWKKFKVARSFDRKWTDCPRIIKKITTFHKSENDVILTKFFDFIFFVYEESKSERFS